MMMTIPTMKEMIADEDGEIRIVAEEIISTETPTRMTVGEVLECQEEIGT